MDFLKGDKKMRLKYKIIVAGLTASLVYTPLLNIYTKISGEALAREANNKYTATLDSVVSRIKDTKDNILDGIISFSEDPIEARVRNAPLERVVIGEPYNTVSGFFANEEGTWSLNAYYDVIKNAPENQRLIDLRKNKDGIFSFGYLQLGDTLYVPNCDGK